MADQLTLVIGSRRYSSWSLRPWLLLKQAGAAFDQVEIALRQPDTKAEILKWSPSGKVPLLVAGPLKIWDSLAICEYVAEMFPALWPADPAARAVARAVAAEMHSGFQALRQACPMDVAAHTPMAEVPAEVAADVARINALWIDCRTRFGANGPFLFGDFSVADAMFAPVVTRYLTYDLPAEGAAAAYLRTIADLPAMKEWAAGA
ncbi:MAG: glutathione S-transferase family protein [Actinomycetota bacterium]